VNKIYVIGIGFRPLEKAARNVICGSDDVLANSRLLDAFKVYEEYEEVRDRIIVHGSVYETLDYIRDNYRHRKITLLAAGDPMFFGIGRLVIERFGKEAVEIYPDLSSIQAAFSKIKETSSGALLISFHGGPDPAKRRTLEYDMSALPRLLNQYHKIGILTDKVNNPAVIAKELLKPSAISCQLSAVTIYVCEKLGYPDERVTEGSPHEIADKSYEYPNVVIVVKNEGRDQKFKVKLGIREKEIVHSKGMITKDEVRAVTLHKLRLPPKGVFWDIGAGSGSVSIEAAGLCPELNIFAIEKNESQARNIIANREEFNAFNVEVSSGEAPDILIDLPAPDRVFIGGSGGKISEIVDLVCKKMETGALVVNAVTIDTLNEAVHSLEQHNLTVEITEVSVSRSKMIHGKRHMSALNPVFIIAGEKS
jgi:precorrin-6Y C5,15-methyltransferase (decarboxylating)